MGGESRVGSEIARQPGHRAFHQRRRNVTCGHAHLAKDATACCSSSLSASPSCRLETASNSNLSSRFAPHHSYGAFNACSLWWVCTLRFAPMRFAMRTSGICSSYPVNIDPNRCTHMGTPCAVCGIITSGWRSYKPQHRLRGLSTYPQTLWVLLPRSGGSALCLACFRLRVG